MSIHNALNTGVYSKLTTGLPLFSLVAGKIYPYLAPDEAAIPFVVFSPIAGGPDNDAPPNMRTQVVQIMAYGSTPAQAGSVDTVISGLFHRGSVTVSGYVNIWCVRNTDLSSIEVLPNGEKVYAVGADYELRFTA